jgi:hypothetical protein
MSREGNRAAMPLCSEMVDMVRAKYPDARVLWVSEGGIEKGKRPQGEEVTQVIVNSETSLQSALGELRDAFRSYRYFSFKLKLGKDRSVEQNAVAHGWYAQVARELREDDPRGVKRFCKLHFGVPILRAEDEEFRAAYDAVVKPLAYEKKLIAMDMLPVTSQMTTRQTKQYMTDVQDHYRPLGVLLVFKAEGEA